MALYLLQGYRDTPLDLVEGPDGLDMAKLYQEANEELALPKTRWTTDFLVSATPEEQEACLAQHKEIMRAWREDWARRGVPNAANDEGVIALLCQRHGLRPVPYTYVNLE